MPNHQEIIQQLSSVIPREVIFEVTMDSIIAGIVHRLGEEALSLSVEDIELAKDEVKAAIEQHLDEREYIEMGLDAWDIIRNLQ